MEKRNQKEKGNRKETERRRRKPGSYLALDSFWGSGDLAVILLPLPLKVSALLGSLGWDGVVLLIHTVAYFSPLQNPDLPFVSKNGDQEAGVRSSGQLRASALTPSFPSSEEGGRGAEREAGDDKGSLIDAQSGSSGIPVVD